jgi:aspartyl protease family protein
MALSSGTRTLLGEILSWVVLAAACAGTLIYYQDLKRLTATVLGMSTAERIAAATPASHGPSHGEVKSNRGGTVELHATSNGHFQARVDVNGRSIDVMVDTGASMVALTFEDAEKAGIFLRDIDYTQRVSTANGIARIAPVTLSRVSIGGITVHNVEAAVAEPGKLQISLLGMTFLSRLDRVDMRSGTLLLQD